MKNLLEGLVSALYPYRAPLFKFFLAREGNIRKDIEICTNSPHILLLHPKFAGRARPRTTKMNVLKRTFNEGVTDAAKFEDFVTNARQ